MALNVHMPLAWSGIALPLSPPGKSFFALHSCSESPVKLFLTPQIWSLPLRLGSWFACLEVGLLLDPEDEMPGYMHTRYREGSERGQRIRNGGEAS